MAQPTINAPTLPLYPAKGCSNQGYPFYISPASGTTLTQVNWVIRGGGEFVSGRLLHVLFQVTRNVEQEWLA